MKTPYQSYSINGITKGCKYCVRGEKLVLFISGVCNRNCNYCSLSTKRKNKDIIFANERSCKSTKDAITEAIESNATSAGITGGDPLLFLNRTLKYSKALKNKFSKKFHIHIYLPTKYLTKNKLEKLSKNIDEVRFHPEFICNHSKEIIIKDIEKIKLANLFFNKNNIGIELPIIPDRKKEILNFIIKISPYIGFVNLNEFEISDTNFNFITKNYSLNQGGYTIKNSIKSGLWILKELKKIKTKLKIHLCTAELKNNYQFKNRLKRHKILPFGKKTKDGLVKYLAIYFNNNKELNELKKSLKGKFYSDKNKNRIIISQNLAKKLLINNKTLNICLVEEFPTFDGLEVDKEFRSNHP
jgi:pyruvate formate-lyase activating enzyme-like uncharacterized protein